MRVLDDALGAHHEIYIESQSANADSCKYVNMHVTAVYVAANSMHLASFLTIAVMHWACNILLVFSLTHMTGHTGQQYACCNPTHTGRESPCMMSAIPQALISALERIYKANHHSRCLTGQFHKICLR